MKVKVLEVDLARQRISLSMRMSDEPGKGRTQDSNQRGTPLSRQQARQNTPPPSNNSMAAAFAKLKR